MMMQKNKVKVIYFITIILIFMIGILAGRFVKEKYVIYHEKYIIPNTDKMFEYTQIYGLKNKKKENSINASMMSSQTSWVSDSAKNDYFNYPKLSYQSADYLSTGFQVRVAKSNKLEYYFINCNVDIKKGKILYLSDIIDVNPMLAQRIKYEGILESPEGISTEIWFENDGKEYLSNLSIDKILEGLNECSEDYTKSNYFSKCSFYLGQGRINFIKPTSSTFERGLVGSIKLDDVEEFLKVEKW